MKKILLIALMFVAGHGAIAQKINTKLLIGKWQSTQDRNVKVIFTRNIKSEFYQNKIATTDYYKIEKMPEWIQINEMTSDGDTLKYGINTLNAKFLSVTYMGRGNTLTYKRIK